MTQNKVYRPYFATTKDARVVQTRKALRESLLRLLDKKPLEDITIGDIASGAGVNYTTFCRHYPGKQDLLDDIAAGEIQQLFELTLPAIVATDTHSGTRALWTYVDENRALWSRLLNGGAAARLRQEFLRMTQEFAQQHGSEHDWLPAEVGVMFGAGSTLDLLGWWLQQEDPIPVEQLATIHERLVVRPLLGKDD